LNFENKIENSIVVKIRIRIQLLLLGLFS